jgi:hypothetical protein
MAASAAAWLTAAALVVDLPLQGGHASMTSGFGARQKPMRHPVMAKALGNAIHDDGAFADLGAEGRGLHEARPAVAQAAIDVVGQQPQVVLDGQVAMARRVASS